MPLIVSGIPLPVDVEDLVKDFVASNAGGL